MSSPKATILIVDDELQNRRLLEALLQPEGYLTQVAANGEEALASIARRAPDLILLDVMMPGMDGYQVARLLKANPATLSIPIIMVTALVDRDARMAGLDAGAEEFLTKPFDRSELWLRVRNLLRLKEYGDFLRTHNQLLEQQVLERTADLRRSTDLQMAEAARQVAILDALPAHIALLDRKGCIIFVNQEWRQFGSDNELVGPIHCMGVNYLAVCDAGRHQGVDDAARAGDGIRSVLGGDAKTFSMEYPCDSPSGQRWFLMAVTRLSEQLTSGVIVMHTNITVCKQAEEEVVRLNLELEERVRLRTAQLQVANQELEAFSYSASHDLRTPLNAIDGYSSLLGKEISSGVVSERSKHFLSRIRAGVMQMGELIDALLSLAQVSRSKLCSDSVDLSALAATILDDYCEREPQRSVLIHIQPDLQVTGDHRLLHQVMDNLLSNAWKFSSHMAQSSIAFSCTVSGSGENMYTVQDNGAGFDMAYADKLFGAFQRMHTAAEFAGTGIGLATVQRIIARHGGRIWTESAPGQGASFHFTLGQLQD